jgi:hypothetical protein
MEYLLLSVINSESVVQVCSGAVTSSGCLLGLIHKMLCVLAKFAVPASTTLVSIDCSCLGVQCYVVL